MRPLDVTKILGNKTRPWFHVFELTVNRQAASKFFTVDPVVADEPGSGNADYWAVEFDCGLRVGFEFFHSYEGASVYADLPCAQHARRHLRHWDRQLIEVPSDVTELDRTSMIERFWQEIPELLDLDEYQVWRQGDDGNPVSVGFPTTRRDAECWVAELESSFHKQIYWITRLDPTV